MEINKSGIRFKTILKEKFYLWSEVDYIELTGKQFLKFLFVSVPTEATTFRFKDQSTLIIWADYYRNISDLRTVLERATNLLKENLPLSSLDLNINRYPQLCSTIDLTHAEEYNGNHLLSLNGLFFYGIIGVISYAIWDQGLLEILSNKSTLFLICFGFFFIYIVYGYQMHYFILTEKFLIVKNSIWFWRKRIYPLDNIREVVFETPYRHSTSMRVITKDFHSKLYPAGSLRKITWRLLKEKIKLEEIKVRNEALV